MTKTIKTKIREKESLEIDEAIENLTTIAEMEVDKKTPIGILQNTRLTTTEEDFLYKEIEWLFPEDYEGFLERIKPSFIAVLDYFKKIFNNLETDWEDESLKKGIQSIMALVASSATKLNRYFSLFNKDVDFTKRKEFLDIQRFYVDNIEKKVSLKLSGADIWTMQWEENKEKEAPDFDKSGLKDFSVVLQDKDYELFYIKNIDGESFFSPELIRNIKLFTYFDDAVEIKDDLFVKIRVINNKDLFFSSKQILKEMDKDIHDFYKYKFDWRENHLSGSINKSFMALMLASNPKIFEKTKPRKSSLEYFNDFKNFLRSSFKTDEYQKTLVLGRPNKDKKANFLINLLHKLSYAFFTRLGGVKEEVIGYIHRMIRKGKEKEKLREDASIWNYILEDDDNIRSYLKEFPSGPLIKLAEDLESISEEEKVSFDPILQGNIPQKLYEMVINDLNISVLHLPSPTIQEEISKAVLVDEFLGFLREHKNRKTKHLLINLQDSTSWREAARAKVIVDIQKRAEFIETITVISLSKNSAFYSQVDPFTYINDAEKFIHLLKEQIFSHEDKGYFLPKKIRENKTFEKFMDKVCLFIHKTFFSEKKDLSKQERRDFIELFFHFLVLKVIEMEKPSTLSFTCKDGIDLGSAMSGSFFSFVKLLSSPDWKKEDEDFLLWLFYEEAILIRQRAIEPDSLIRQLSTIALIHSHLKGLKKAMKELYSEDFIDGLRINYLR